MKRTLTNHIVVGDPAPQLIIEVTDEPGQGGANHRYEITGCDTSRNPSADPNWFPLVTYLLFQNGPIAEVGVNGITQEALLAIVIDRLESFQMGPYACADNEEALELGRAMLRVLQRRTLNRIARGVEGTNKA